ncbi:hypothetical protein RMSM_00738 [Rhodopirellula maiorica SM1]|uniref:Uncharacterized protein n=1 Tax=Rhodopirellula maiorica SM1 TaxID=1265738 RepID=M5RSM7_9BACT|nr:hypothetical protein RMSM_00738 [Rhodopirellula maiorica SM1]
MQPKFLFVEWHRVLVIAEKQRVFQQDDSSRIAFQTRVIREQLMGENEKDHDSLVCTLSASCLDPTFYE